MPGPPDQTPLLFVTRSDPFLHPGPERFQHCSFLSFACPLYCTSPTTLLPACVPFFDPTHHPPVHLPPRLFLTHALATRCGQLHHSPGAQLRRLHPGALESSLQMEACREPIVCSMSPIRFCCFSTSLVSSASSSLSCLDVPLNCCCCPNFLLPPSLLSLAGSELCGCCGCAPTKAPLPGGCWVLPASGV